MSLHCQDSQLVTVWVSALDHPPLVCQSCLTLEVQNTIQAFLSSPHTDCSDIGRVTTITEVNIFYSVALGRDRGGVLASSFQRRLTSRQRRIRIYAHRKDQRGTDEWKL